MRNLKLLAAVIIAFLVGTITSSTLASAENDNDKNPFKKIWSAIRDLQIQINNIKLVPGPPGPQGPAGPQGPKGDPAGSTVHLEAGTCGQPVTNGGVTAQNGWCPDGANNEIFFIADSKVTANSVISVTTSNPPFTIGPNCYVLQLFPAEGFDLRCAEHGTNYLFVPVGTKLNYVINN